MQKLIIKSLSKKLKVFQAFTTVALGGLLVLLPLAIQPAMAAGISVSGGGAKTVGSSFTVKVVASGAEFDSLQGTINVSGPVTVSVAGGSATWLPGKSPSNGGQFVGIVTPTTSLTVATLTLKGTKEGSGSVSVSGVSLARNGSYVGSSGGSTSFTIGRAPTPPGTIVVTSTTNPDPAQTYGVTTVVLNWTAPGNGATGYSTAFDKVADTTPPQTANTTTLTASYADLGLGTYYFHIRANNGDGWGPTTHFTVNIGRAVDTTLSAPVITAASKTANFQTDLNKGTVSGLTINGSGGLSGYTVELSFDPKDRLPAELFTPVAASTTTSDKTDAGVGTTTATPDTTATTTPTVATALTPLQTTPNADGSWSVSFNYPIPSGFYTLTAQSQKDKVLSPASTPVYLEVSVANGGSVRLITAADQYAKSSAVKVLGINFKSPTQLWLIVAGAVVVLLVLASGGFYWWIRRRRSRKI